jgi:quaternary ammonium compound-resistance protein SugE
MVEELVGQKDDATKVSKGWTYLILAGLFEPIWVVSMKLSEGFTQIIWTAATFVFLFFSMYFLALALRSKVPVGTAYSIWVGIGAIGALIAGILLFDESSDIVRLGFVLLIVVGIVGLQATSREEGS